MTNLYYEQLQNQSEGWSDLTRLLETHTVHDMIEIMDDALANGFEFKLQGSHIYYRERTE